MIGTFIAVVMWWLILDDIFRFFTDWQRSLVGRLFLSWKDKCEDGRDVGDCRFDNVY